VENYVGWGNTIHLAFEYDVKAVIPLIMICFHQLNPIVQECNVDGLSEEFNEEDNNLYGVGASIEEFSSILVIGDLSLFTRLPILQATSNDPLAWWCISEGQFSNITFLAKQILGKPGSQIERENVFNLVGLITSLQCCCLQAENLNHNIIIVNNWPNDVCFNCKKKVDMKEYMKVKASLVDNNYDLIEKVEYFKELHIDDEV